MRTVRHAFAPKPAKPAAEELFLSRPEYDRVLAANGPALRRAFADCKRGRAYGAGAYEWSLAGVRMWAVSPANAAAIRAILAAPAA